MFFRGESFCFKEKERGHIMKNVAKRYQISNKAAAGLIQKHAKALNAKLKKSHK